MRRLRLWLLTLLLVLAACTGGKKAEPFSFIVLDDIHFAQQEDYLSDKNLDQRTRLTIEQSQATFIPFMKELKERAEAEGPRTAAIFNCGDLVHGGAVNPDALYRSFFREYNSVGMPLPFYNVNGNHEIAGAGMEEAYDRYLLPFLSSEAGKEIRNRYYSLDFGNSHFVIIDGQPRDRKGGDHEKRVFDLVGEQWRWLENDLEANKNKEHIFLFSHPTIWPVNSGDVLYVYDPEKQSQFVNLLLKYKVRAFFAGHEHVNTVLVYDDLGNELVQMIPNSEIRLDEPGEIREIRDYTIENVAGDEQSPWASDLRTLVGRSKDKIRYFRKQVGLAGYFLVTVDGGEVKVRMYRSPGSKLHDEYRISRLKETGETRFTEEKP